MAMVLESGVLSNCTDSMRLCSGEIWFDGNGNMSRLIVCWWGFWMLWGCSNNFYWYGREWIWCLAILDYRLDSRRILRDIVIMLKGLTISDIYLSNSVSMLTLWRTLIHGLSYFQVIFFSLSWLFRTPWNFSFYCFNYAHVGMLEYLNVLLCVYVYTWREVIREKEVLCCIVLALMFSANRKFLENKSGNLAWF